MQRTIIVILYAAVLISGVLTIQGWVRRRQANWVLSYAILSSGLFIWSLGYALELTLPTLAAKILMAKVQYVGITAVPFGWFTFAAKYGGFENKLTKKTYALLSIIPFATILIAFTNDYHHLLWKNLSLETIGNVTVLDISHGPWFWVNWVFAQAQILLGTIIMVWAFPNFHTGYQNNLLLLILAAFIPWVGNVLYITDLNPIPYLDWTPVTFTISGLLLSIGAFWLNFLDLLPIARQTAVSSLPDGILIIDKNGKIVEANAAAERALKIPTSLLIGKTVQELAEKFDQIRPLYTNLQNNTQPPQQEIVFFGKIYDLTKAHITDQQGQIRGLLLTLRDITSRKQSEAALAAQMRLFESMVTVAQATHGNLTTEDLLKKTVEVAIALTNAEEGSLFALDESGDVRSYLLAKESTSIKSKRFTQQVLQQGVAGWVYQHKRPALIHDTRLDKRWLWHPDEARNPRSALVIPIILESRVVGVLSLHHSKPHFFKDQDAQLMQAAANQMALALRNAEVYEAQRRTAHHHQILYRILRHLSTHMDAESILHEAVQTIHEQTQWTAVAIIEPTKDQQQLHVTAASGALQNLIGEQFPINRGITGRVLRTGQTQIVPNISLDPDRIRDVDNIRSLVSAPMEFQGKKIGVFTAQSSEYDAFDDEDVWLVEALADACTLAIANARLYAQTRQQLQEQTILRQAVSAIATNIELSSILNKAASHLCQILEATSAAIFEYDAKTQQTTLMALHLTDEANPKEEATQHQHFIQFYKHNAPHLEAHFDMAYTDSASDSARLSFLAHEGIQTTVRIPLPQEAENSQTAFVEIWDSKHKWRYSESQMKLAIAIVYQVAIALSKARLFQSIDTERTRLKALVESSREGIVLVDNQQQILVINQMALDLLELPGTVANWQGLEMSLMMPHAGTFVTAVSTPPPDQRHNTVSWEGELEIGARYLNWRKIPIHIQSGTSGHFILIRDVTNDHLLAKMRDDLIHMMVHDMRNPLNATSLSLEILQRLLPEGSHPNLLLTLDRAIKSNALTLDLVNKILDINRLENNRLELNYQSFDLKALVDEVFQLDGVLAREKSILLHNEIEEETFVFADYDIIHRVLQNLVSNAIKFTPENGRVSISTHLSKHSNVVRITVQDNGTGIPKEIKTRLFEKFVSGRQSAQRGHGLGLAFCKLALESHHQKIWVAKSNSEGTAIAFTLPLATQKLPETA